MLIRFFVLFFSLLSMFATAASDIDVKKLMSAEEFKEAGLHSLSSEQVEALNRWLIRYTAHDAKTLMQTSTAVKESAKTALKYTIDGEFNGWNGKTYFKLKNGQIWETRYDKRYKYRATDPQVEISKNFMGLYMLKVVATGKKIGVKRIK